MYLRSSSVKSLASVAKYSFGYFSLAFLALHLGTITNFASPIWPASGIGAYAYRKHGLRSLFGIWLASTLANFATGAAIIPSSLIGTSAVFEAIFAVVIFEKIELKDAKQLGRNLLLKLISFGVASIGAAAIGAGVLSQFSIISDYEYVPALLSWWGGNFLGLLLVFQILVGEEDKEKLFSLRDYNKLKLFYTFISIASVACVNIFLSHLGHFASGVFVVLMVSLHPMFWESRSKKLLLLNVFCLSIFVAIALSPHADLAVTQQKILIGYGLSLLAYFSISYPELLRKTGMYQSLRGPLAIGGLTFFGVISIFSEQVKDFRQSKLNEYAGHLKNTIHLRMDRYAQDLQSAEAFVRATATPTAEQWKTYLGSLDLNRRLPALANMGMVERVKADERKSYLSRMTKMYGQDFLLHPVPGFEMDSKENYFISMIEPLERNRKALGLDLRSEVRRRNALNVAAEYGVPAMTAPIRLVQDPQKRLGFLLTVTAVDKFQKQFWIYAPIVSELFFDVGDAHEKTVSYELVDAEFPGEGALFRGQEFSKWGKYESVQTRFMIARRQAILTVRANEKFLAEFSTYTLWATAVAVIAVLLVSHYVGAIYSVSMRAKKMADEMAVDLDLQRSKALYAAKMSSLGEMAGGVAHEINNPLTIVISLAGQIQRALSGEAFSKDEVISKTKKIISTADRIAKIIKGLRSFSRNADRDPRIECAMLEIIENTVAMCSERFKIHCVKLEISILPDVVINCSPVEISQVLLNLLNNSFDAINELPEKWINITALVVDGVLRLSVEDSGNGIPSDVVYKMMQPFFSTKEVGKGTGLGLSISKGIIESHHGRLYYDQNCTHTRFVIELPMKS